jgi:hypothetical protein
MIKSRYSDESLVLDIIENVIEKIKMIINKEHLFHFSVKDLLFISSIYMDEVSIYYRNNHKKKNISNDLIRKMEISSDDINEIMKKESIFNTSIWYQLLKNVLKNIEEIDKELVEKYK